MYELLALWMRYFFALLAVLFVVRAWIITVRDNRRARMIRAWLPETGTIGEWLVLEGGAQARKGTKFPLLNEGLIGASRRADVRVSHADVLSEHAYFTATETGIRVRPVGDASVSVQSHLGGVFYPADGYVDMEDGDVLALGKFRMLLTLFDLRASRHVAAIPPETDGGEESLDEQLDAMEEAAAPRKRKGAQADDVELELPWQSEKEAPTRRR